MLLAMPFNIAATYIAAILKRIAAMLPLLHHYGNAAIAKGIAAMPFGIAAFFVNVCFTLRKSITKWNLCTPSSVGLVTRKARET